MKKNELEKMLIETLASQCIKNYNLIMEHYETGVMNEAFFDLEFDSVDFEHCNLVCDYTSNIDLYEFIEECKNSGSIATYSESLTKVTNNDNLITFLRLLNNDLEKIYSLLNNEVISLIQEKYNTNGKVEIDTDIKKELDLFLKENLSKHIYKKYEECKDAYYRQNIVKFYNASVPNSQLSLFF